MNHTKYRKQFSGPNNNLELLPRFTDDESKTQGSKDTHVNYMIEPYFKSGSSKGPYLEKVICSHYSSTHLQNWHNMQQSQ